MASLSANHSGGPAGAAMPGAAASAFRDWGPPKKGDGAGDGIRTRDILLGKQTLCQLSYSRSGGFTVYETRSG